ncbi:BTAD domain-containing putative transcriptional regulator [Actinoplanes sp. NEAU-A12]|uniref:BTAD domain-containing putative transcriptional regulator n=1 Tax=Actinoplanes sandaracinus TaxID=3045177 RepID=A0ABT6WSP5_9ACTN|nr:BTAD domain-containing putative transcriptional regulator [Actinoplanes sandaracinus]MDI6102750.1 BTAD domain-containing putative transcriptional regulator [Actinoplanes sandaracinus]
MQIGMLGSFEVRTDDGTPVDVPGARLRALLIALALDPGRVAGKATLVDWIWGEQPPADATNALHRLMSRLRKALPEGSIEGHPDGYRLRVGPDAVDAVRFERLVTAAQVRTDDPARRVRLLRDALALWRGAAMQDVVLPDSAAFGAAVTRLEALRLTASEDRFEAEAGLGDGAGLVTELTGLVAAHPLRERLVGALMRALAAAGRGNEALTLYQRTREALAEELGADPSPELSALHVALLRGDGARREERRTNLRAELSSYIGKESDVAAVRDLVAGHRLTTLIGPGGSGKTRLATETARTLLGDLPDGVWLVELAAIGADGDVAQAALTGLSLRDSLLGEAPSADLTERLITAIRDRELMLILDNCEHVIEAAATLAHRLLGECRRLRILATSREPLGITGEALWPVEPLGLPATDAGPDDAAASPAVRLLRERAGAVRKDLTINTDTLMTMVRVCRALDGMPLAIELAAARLRTMTLDQLAHRLDDRFRLLTGGSRTALPRHRTLRAMVDWSWELLTDAERAVLRRLAVFAGGASLEAAEGVCAGDGVGREDVLELLTSLAEKSLLVTAGGDAPRYRMLGTIKEYAAQRLTEAGEAGPARQAHLAWFTELAETADPHLRRGEQMRWLATLEAEHDNIGSAMRGALAAGDAPGAMRLAGAAGWYWWLSGRKAEGFELILAATGTPGEVDDEVRALAYALVVLFAGSGRADANQAAEWIHKTYELRQRSGSRNPVLGLIVPLERMLREPDAFLPAWEPMLENPDPWVRALARLHLGKMRIMLGHGGREADAYLETALAEFRALGERFGVYFALTELADRIATRGEFARACEYYEEAIVAVTEVGSIEDVIQMRARQVQLYRMLGDEKAAASALAEAERCAERVTWPDALAELALAKAEIARLDGDAGEARRQLAEAEALLGERAGASVLGYTHDLRGYLAEDLAEARAHRVAAYRAAVEAGHAPLLALVLVGFADLALRQDDPGQAARLLAAAIAIRGLRDRSNPQVARIEQAARSRLGDTEFAEAVREGTVADWRQLIEVTLAS